MRKPKTNNPENPVNPVAKMNLEIIDPIKYPGWDELLLASDDHSFFHTSAWARINMIYRMLINKCCIFV
jgi:hypothetical protein